MFAGHYSAAFAAKAVEPKTPLWSLLVAAQFVDILWGICILTGIEHAQLDPSLPSNPLVLEDMPYTHSLAAAAAWALVAFVLARRVLGVTTAAAFAIAATVASHWFLDWLVHRPDLTVAGGTTKLGLSLWNYPLLAYSLEIALVAATAWACVRACGIHGPRLRPWLGLAGMLIVLQTATSFGPLPTSVSTMIVSALAVYVLVPIVGARVERAATR